MSVEVSGVRRKAVGEGAPTTSVTSTETLCIIPSLIPTVSDVPSLALVDVNA